MSLKDDTSPSSSEFPPFLFFLFFYLVNRPSSSLSSFSSLLRASAPASHQHQHLGSARRVKAQGGLGWLSSTIYVCSLCACVCLCVNLGALRLLCVYSLSFQITSFPVSPAIWLLCCPLPASHGAVCNYELLSVFLSHTTTLQRELSWCHYPR